MSWLFSLALVEESSAGTYLVGELSQPWSGTLTPLAFLSHDKTTNFSRLSRFGVTFRPLMDDLGEELLMSYLAGFHAKTSVLPEKAQALGAHGPGCGGTWPASLARFDPISSLWKTAQLSLLGDSESSSVIWPRSGMTADGQCWELPTLERRTSATVSGLLPTPLASNTKAVHKRSGGRPPRSYLGPIWPTPVASDTSSRTKPYAQGGTPLSLAVKFPTPTAHNAKEGAHPSEYERNCPTLATHAGGPLNPMWVEKLMGWPDDWSLLQPISHVKMCFWVMGMSNGTETGRSEVLRVLRRGDAAQEIQRAIGRPVGIQEAAILLAELCEHSNRPDEARLFMACAEALEELLRGVQLHDGASGAPHRPEQDQQLSREHPNVMQALSRLLAHHGKTAWKDGSWEDATHRMATGVAARVDRLKAIGNGQVPLCAAEAWRILRG